MFGIPGRVSSPAPSADSFGSHALTADSFASHAPTADSSASLDSLTSRDCEAAQQTEDALYPELIDVTDVTDEWWKGLFDDSPANEPPSPPSSPPMRREVLVQAKTAGRAMWKSLLFSVVLAFACFSLGVQLRVSGPLLVLCEFSRWWYSLLLTEVLPRRLHSRASVAGRTLCATGYVMLALVQGLRADNIVGIVVYLGHGPLFVLFRKLSRSIRPELYSTLRLHCYRVLQGAHANSADLNRASSETANLLLVVL